MKLHYILDEEVFVGTKTPHYLGFLLKWLIYKSKFGKIDFKIFVLLFYFVSLRPKDVFVVLNLFLKKSQSIFQLFYSFQLKSLTNFIIVLLRPSTNL